MNRIRLPALLLAALTLLLGCSREGFEASLSRDSAPSSSEAQPGKLAAVGAVYELDRLSEEGLEGEYLVPATDQEEQEKAVKRISRSIRGVVRQLPELLAAEGDSPALSLETEVTRNDGEYFSLSFLLTAKSGETERRYIWGMVFDSATGGPASLDRFIEPEALSVLLLDGPSVNLLEEEQEIAEAQRSYLAGEGSETLRDRLNACDYGEPQTLLDASYYLESSRLVAVFAAPQEAGETVRAAIQM